MSNVGQRALVLRNDGGNRARWLGIRTIGTRSNRDGIGCRVKVVSASGTRHYTVTTAISYLSAGDKRLLVGLGSADTASLVEIRWPSGTVQALRDVPAGKTVDAVEPTP